MPQEEVFLEIQAGSDMIRVVKTYDAGFARECFELMDNSSLKALSDSLRLEDSFDENDIPSTSDVGYADFLWQEMYDSAREESQIRSFFVVTRTAGDRREPLYVSGDWPSAESYAKDQQLTLTK